MNFNLFVPIRFPCSVFQLFLHNDLVFAAAAALPDRPRPQPHRGLPRLRPLRPARVPPRLRARPLPPPLRAGRDTQLLRRSLLRRTGETLSMRVTGVCIDWIVFRWGVSTRGAARGVRPGVGWCSGQCAPRTRPWCTPTSARPSAPE